MLAKHAGKDPKTVKRALRAANVTLEIIPGVRGYRITERDANRFLFKQWPEAGAIRVEEWTRAHEVP
jgi:hypothetical protein